MKKQLMIAAIALLAFACKKNENVDGIIEQQKASPVSVVANQKQVANLRNPFDDAGLAHNKGLDYVLHDLGNPDKIRLVEIEKVARKYALDSLHAPLPAEANSDVQKILLDGKNDFANVIKASLFSPQAKTYARQLIGLMSETSPFKSDYRQLKEAVMKLETVIAANTKLPEAERTALLQGTSVARYSIYYWSNADLPTEFRLFVAAHDVIGTILLGRGFGMFASAAARAVQRQDWGFFIGQY